MQRNLSQNTISVFGNLDEHVIEDIIMLNSWWVQNIKANVVMPRKDTWQMKKPGNQADTEMFKMLI